MGGRGSGGKNRKPTAQKKAEGNRGKRKPTPGVHEPAALPGEPPIPRGLSAPVRQAWPIVCKMLHEAGVLFKTDAIAVAALCSSLVLFQQADRAVAKYGCLCVELDEVTGAGVLRTNPAVRVRSDALRHLRSSWQGFGLDPSSRMGVQIPDPDPKGRSETALDSILRSKSSKDDFVM
jgi:P27 family predicted phage terminase small subunit